MFEDDTYQFLGRQVQRYFEETKQNHLGRVEALDLGAKPRELIEGVLRGRLFVDKCAFSNHRDGINPLSMIASQPVENIDLNNFNVNDQANIEREFSQGSSRQIYKIGSRVRTIDNESSTSGYGLSRTVAWLSP